MSDIAYLAIMKKTKQNSKERLNGIQLKIENIITNNRNEVGQGHSFQTIEEGLFTKMLSLGRLLLEDRIIEEENRLEHSGYEIKGKKNE